VLVVCITFAGGYQINEQGARAVGMGGAFVARASDPSAIYYNPAGLVDQKGINVLGGLDLIIPSTSFAGIAPLPTASVSTNSQVFTPINLYGTYQVNDDIVVGLGIYNPFGLGTEWPSTWIGSSAAIKSSVSTWYFNPSIGYKINEDLSVGLGISYVYGSATMTTSHMSLDGTGSGFNANIGAIYKPMPGLSVGLSYRIETDIKFSGNVSMPAYGINSKTGDATLPMPGNLQVGAAYDLMPELTLEADLQYVQWNAYKTLDLNLPAPVGKISEVKKWNDGTTVRVGAEYKYSPEITLRGGLIMDLTPQPSSTTEPMLPDADRYDISLGGSYKIDNNWHVDASYMLVLFSDKTVGVGIPNNSLHPGTYSSTAHVISVNVGYAF
jgi:long-chain fatty acid transport protein